jgi:hypothetical protein
MNSWIAVVAGIGGVVLGAVIAGLFGLLTPKLQDRRDHARWLREARLAAYSDYLGAIDLWMDTSTTRWLEDRINGIEQSVDRGNLLEDEVSRAQSKVYLLGPDPVRVVAAEYHHAVVDHIVSVQSAPSLNDAANVDTGALRAARGLVLGMTNRILGIQPL